MNETCCEREWYITCEKFPEHPLECKQCAGCGNHSHQSEKPAPEGWKLKTEIDDAAKKIMKITEVNDWPEGDLMEIDVRDLLKKLLAAQKKEIVERVKRKKDDLLRFGAPDDGYGHGRYEALVEVEDIIEKI